MQSSVKRKQIKMRGNKAKCRNEGKFYSIYRWDDAVQIFDDFLI